MKKILHKFIHFIILPCKDATFLIEKQLHTKLSLKESLQLKAHLQLCKLCLAYSKKAAIIHQWLRKNLNKDIIRTPKDSDELENFKRNLKEKLHKHS